jgi:hypothetical protein
MGILENVVGSLKAQFAIHNGVAVVVTAVVTVFVVLVVIVNVLRQLLFKNPNEPPVVFHWFPIIGSTVTYGLDPYKFFFDCRAKVCRNYSHLITDRLIENSMATFSLSFCSARRRQYIWEHKATNSSSTASSRMLMPKRFTRCSAPLFSGKTLFMIAPIRN